VCRYAAESVQSMIRFLPTSDELAMLSMYAVGLCRLNQIDPYPITYSLSNP
jgi:hypothetical protein